ncbi:preprotein translocase subunit SecE [Paludibacterium denitrificans]|uniref:preprotein translocase subunit SecE n=1 Tax=Paludibacterium denitrificans TaxID=2675226 RepID=UPI0028A64763|nr:preprotein translocase subunit SecE [Paludibacterium denitrificans]
MAVRARQVVCGLCARVSGGSSQSGLANRKEALQMTGMVFVFVFVLALFMWGVDSSLSWLFYDVILGRGR